MRHARLQRGALAQQVAQSQHSKRGGKGKGAGRSRGTAGKGKREGQIVKMILVNRANHCYTNAPVWSLSLLDAQYGEAGILPVRLAGLLKSFTTTNRPVVVWDSMFWRALLSRWVYPHSQHDVADFLQHLGTCCPGLVESLGFRWEARSQETGDLETVDAGCSMPLYVSPSSEVQSGRVGTTVQRLIDDWHGQADMHAATSAPRALIVQAGRFSQDQQGNPVG